jgi:hypothetical protein
MHDSPPLPDRIRAAIALLGDNYSKSAAQIALSLLREVLPLLEAPQPGGPPPELEPDPRIRHAQAVAECLWHTLRRIGELDPTDEKMSKGEFRGEVRRLAARRTSLIADLPADETISDGAWLGVNTIRAELEELADLRARVGQFADESGLAEPHFRWKTTVRSAFGQEAGFGPYRPAGSEFLFKVVAAVMPLRVHIRLVRRGIEIFSTIEPKPEQLQLLEELAAEYARAVAPLYTPPSTKPVEVGGRVSVERVRFNQGVRPELLPRLAAAAHVLENATENPTIAETTVKLIRELLDGVDDQPEVVNSKFRDVFWLSGDLTGFRFDHLPDVIIPDDNAQAMLHQYMVKSAKPPAELFAVVREAQVGNLPAIAPPGRLFLAFGPPVDRMGQRVMVHVYYLVEGRVWIVDRGELDLHSLLVMKQDIRLEVHLQHPAEPSAVSWPSSGTAGVDEAVHDVSNEDEFEDEANVGPAEEDGLAARCDVMVTNLGTVMELEGETIPHVARSAMTTAAVLLGEVAADLRARDKEWWVIEDMSAGTDGDATLYAFPRGGLPGLDEAIEKWAHSLERIHAADEHRDPREEPFDVRIDTMAFRPERVGAGLGEHPGALYFVQVPGAMKLMEAIDRLTDGESLYIDDGCITTTYESSDPREPRDVFKLLDYCESPDPAFKHTEWCQVAEKELVGDDAEEAFQAQRTEENLRDHDDFARRTDPPTSANTLAAQYAAAGWDVIMERPVGDNPRNRTHLCAMGTTPVPGLPPVGTGKAACGENCSDGGSWTSLTASLLLGQQLVELDLCARCCAAANDRAAQARAD